MQRQTVHVLVLFLFIVSACCVQAKENLKIAFTGSSTTWGKGLLDENAVGEIDRYLRTQKAQTILAVDLAAKTFPLQIINPKFYQGSATKITGQGNSFSFVMNSKTLSLVQGIERANDNASIIDLYVDGKLYDSFTNFNPSPSGSEKKEFSGDGSTRKFDLGRCFTYAHKVKIDDLLQKGSLNTAGYGGTFPQGSDYVVIRKYVLDPELEKVAVHHVLWFRTPPKAGAKIAVAFEYGENICYAKTTVGELGYGFETDLESKFGDDNLNFAPAAAASLFSGLDFRATDERAIKTWEFSDARERHFELRIRGLDERAKQRGTPYFVLNFVTDTIYRIMNAGIGGWTAQKLAIDPGLRNVRELMLFEPDLVFMQLGINDDWSCGQFVATRKMTGLTETEIKATPSLWLKSLSQQDNSTYKIETSELVILEATENSITIDPEAVDFGDLKAGDILVIGDYHGDERAIQCRLIESWDAKNYRAQFSEPLALTPLFAVERFEDFAGKKVRVKRVDEFIEWMQNCVDTIRAFNPNVAIGIVDTALPNYYTRAILGYPQKLEKFCQENELIHVNSFEALKSWQYSQGRNITAYLGPSASNISRGLSEYSLVDFSGRDIHRAANSSLLRNWSVKVNGQEVYGKDCYITGGRIMGFLDSKRELEFRNWQFPKDYKYVPTKLVFFRNVPPAGSIIEIACTSLKWSGDDTHPNQDGAEIYGKAMIAKLPSLLEKSNRHYEFKEAFAILGASSTAFNMYETEENSYTGVIPFPGKTGIYRLKVSLAQENLGKLQFFVGGQILDLGPDHKSMELEPSVPVFINHNQIVLIRADKNVPAQLTFLPFKQTISQKSLDWEQFLLAVGTENVVLMQAEDYGAEGGGKSSFLTDHKPRSGSGIMNWGPPGHWLEWEVNLPTAGEYMILLSAATTYPIVLRSLSIDGIVPRRELECLEFASTAGWGRSREQWGNFLLHDQNYKPIVIRLSVGVHRLRLTSVYNYLNLDFLALIKKTEDNNLMGWF